MRNNLPVTDIEYELREGQSLVSKTDTKGRITYANPSFIETSGFNEEELIGKAHNIVRHPDMPEEAFADMWSTLQSGMPWTGMVKNRRKNGDYYWVLANVTPIMESGRITGYMSVRTKPSREQINAAAILYRDIKNRTAVGIAIKHGVVIKTGLAGKFAAIGRLPLSLKLGLGMGFSVAMMLVALLVGQAGVIPGAARWSVLANLLAIGTVFYLWRTLHTMVVLPLKTAMQAACAIAAGDLSVVRFSSTRHDDMGLLLQALQQMNVNMQAMIGDVRTNVESITTATADIASGNMDLAQRTETQAASLEKTASSMEELSSTVRQNADGAAQANELAVSASAIAGKGGQVVGRVGLTMSEISASARKIVDIIGLIDSIAFQTNILALNAAVEAARAGEQGKGFAVVAAEVRNLAQRSAGAAKEIKSLIEDSVEKVNEGNRLVEDAGHTMDEIVLSVKRVNDIIGEISTASKEQSAGIIEVNQAISHLDAVTQQNTALVEQTAAAAFGLKDQVSRLSQAVSLFKLRHENTLTNLAALPSVKVLSFQGRNVASENNTEKYIAKA